jgi:hypothetical protein
MDTETLKIKQEKHTFASMAFCDDSVELPEDYIVSDKDILCGRGAYTANESTNNTNDTLCSRNGVLLL